MSEIDFERVSMLLGIVRDIPGTLPQMTSIAGAAAAEIKEINDLAKQEADELARQKAEEAHFAHQQKLQANAESNATDEEDEDEAEEPKPRRL